MARRRRQKAKNKTPSASEKMNRLKAKALTRVAGQAWSVNQRYKSIALLSEALRREPTNTATMLNLAAAYGRQRYYDQAEKLLLRVLELAPRKASLCHQAAQTYAAIDRPEQAIACYRRCLELYQEKSKAVPALVELAALHERRHELDEAEAALAEALQQEPNHEEALLQQALVNLRRGEETRAEATLRDLTSGSTHSPATRSQAWYELGRLLDHTERYDEAYEAFVAAKQIARQYAGPHQREHQFTLAKNRELLQSLDQTYYEKWRSIADEHQQTYRVAILTGHPRSGTTLVEQALDAHPEAISADEFDVFSQWIYLPIMTRFPTSESVLSILDRVPTAVRQQARATYWQQTEAIFAEPIGDRLLIDKNPAMTVVLPIINWAFPEAKMLIALRDPRDVVLSCFMQRLQPNSISVNWLSLESAVDFYAVMMETWLHVRQFTEGSWLEFRYEDVVTDLEGQVRRILDFLGLPWNEQVLRFYEHAQAKMVRSPTYQDVTRPVYQGSVGRWQHYAKYFEPLMPNLERFLNEFGYSR